MFKRGVKLVSEAWHVSKTVSVGHILTSILIVIGGIGALITFENRMTTIEVEQKNYEEVTAAKFVEVNRSVHRLEDKTEALRREMKADGTRREQKLDRLIESLVQK